MKLSVWAEVLAGPTALAGVSRDKWRFLTLLGADAGANGRHYVASWRYDTFRALPKDQPFTHAGSDQYGPVAPGDAVWIVTIDSDRLFLVSRIEVGEVIDGTKAKQRWQQAWDADYHIVARPGTAEPLRQIEITDFLPELRFNGRVGRVPPNWKQSFQRMRRLMPETASLFERAWTRSVPQNEQLAKRERELGSDGEFDPKNDEDARRRTLANIVRRQGQGEFRQKLLAAYGGRCPITGCDAENALEAAHIRPYLGTHTNAMQNGILLRADIHTLFDLQLLSVDPDTWTVVISPALRTGHYATLHGRKIILPSSTDAQPSAAALQLHLDECSFRAGTTA